MAQSTLDTSKDVCVLVREDLAYKEWACQASELMYLCTPGAACSCWLPAQSDVMEAVCLRTTRLCITGSGLCAHQQTVSAA